MNINYTHNCFARSSPKDTITLQLKWRNQFQFAGYYAAKLKGYYAQQRLTVKILPGGPGISPINNVLNNKADIGVSDPGILSKKYKQTDLTVLATIMQSSAYCIISLKEKNILKPSDLVGKKILVSDDQGWSIFKTILLKEGIDPNSVHVAERLKDSEEISNKDVDAVITFFTTQPQRLRALGYKINILRPEEYGVDFYGDILFTSKKYAYQDTHLTDAFIEASMKGWKYALTHENEIIDYILSLPDVKAYGTTRESLEYEARELKKLIMPNLVEVGHTNLGRWQYMLTLFQRLGIAEKNLSLKNFIYETKEHRLSRWYAPAIYTILVISSIIIIITLINNQLRRRIKRSTADLTKEIEQRKIAEHLANENKEQIELILNSSNIGLWEFDIETKKTNFNPQFKKVLGYENDYRFLSEDFFEKIHPEDLKLVQQLFDIKNSNTGSQNMIQFRVQNANKEYIHVLSSSKLLFKNGQPSKISGIVLSIQEIKQKELQILKVSEELIRRNNELKKFAYIISHNLRAPIVNISSLADMIQQDSLNAENKMVFDKIQQSIFKLENTLDDLLEVVSHDKPRDLSEKIDIEENINSAIETVKKQVPNFDIIEVNVNLKIKELISPKHFFESIILNLFTNAIKFNVTGRKTVIDIEAFQDDHFCILKFSDNGIGIDLSKNKSKLFGLYQRFNSKMEGKGIGLFIVKSHMDTLNGKIDVESKPGHGATFTLYFPKLNNG